MALRRHGPLSRTEISALTGLSASTVTVITTALLERGRLAPEAVTEGPPSDYPVLKRGRPQVRLCLNSGAASVAVVVITLNRMHVMIGDYSGRIVATAMDRSRTKGMAGEAIAATAVAALKDLHGRTLHRIGPLQSILVSVEGIVDVEGTALLWSPFIDDDKVPIKAAFEEAFGVPTSLSNDAVLIAEALRWSSAEQYGDNFAAVLLSNGIGMGLYIHGRPFSGIRSSAVEFGHMTYQPNGSLCRCGRLGCVEAYAGGYAIWRRATGMACDEITVFEPPENGLRMIAERARAGEGIERQAFREAGLAIGTGLANLFAVIDPFPVALVGPGAATIDLMRDCILDRLEGAGFGQPFRNDMLDGYVDEVRLISDGGVMHSLVALDSSLPEQFEAN